MANDRSDPANFSSFKIAVLASSMYFLLKNVFILKKGNKYRLLAYHGGKFYYDNLYRTEGGAKIAFLKRFNYRVTESIYSALKQTNRPLAYWTAFRSLSENEWLQQFKGLDITKGWDQDFKGR